MTEQPSTQQVRTFELSAEYRESIMQDFLSEHNAQIAEGEELTFASSVTAWYDNLMDDLHDSSGDAEYQEGVLERMQFMEQYLGAFLEHKYSAAEKLEEAEWAAVA